MENNPNDFCRKCIKIVKSNPTEWLYFVADSTRKAGTCARCGKRILGTK